MTENDTITFDTIDGRTNIAVQEIESMTDMFDNRDYPEIPCAGRILISWGQANDLPYGLINTISSDEVMSANKLFNVQCLYGMGLQYCDISTRQPSRDPEVRRFVSRNNFPHLFLEQATDMKYFYFAVMVLILSRDRKKITRVHHLEACNVRFEKADSRGRIRHVFYADWKNTSLSPSDVECIPLLDTHDPAGDLMACTGREADPETGERHDGGGTKFAILTKFPTPGYGYYPNPYYTAVFKSGWFDIKQLAAVYKKAKLRNFASIKYMVRIHREYWQDLYKRLGITEDIRKQAEARKKEMENIKKFVSGVENSGKMWFSGVYTTPDGKEVSQIQIEKVDTSKEGGDFSEENQEAANMLCYADGIHPNMVGAVPGKTQSNNSGSDKRELFTLKQALELPFRELMYQPHRLIIEFNGWEDKVYPTVPMSLLSTLDTHADSLTVTKNE